MNLLKLNVPTHCHHRHHYHQHRRRQLNLRPPSQFLVSTSGEHFFKLFQSFATPVRSFTKHASTGKVFAANPISIENIKEAESEDFEEYLAEDGEIYQKTLRLVECAMFAAVSALAFLLSNSLAIEKCYLRNRRSNGTRVKHWAQHVSGNAEASCSSAGHVSCCNPSKRYFASLFALPIVLSTMRWGIAAGRKTMVATAVLLFVLSGPVKAITYLVWHGLLGFSMGTLWSVKDKLGYLSLLVLNCINVRAFGGLCNLVIASYLIGENIPALITISMHAVVTNILSSIGVIAVPSMNSIYFIFGFLLMLNCGVSVFFLHLLYAVFFKSFGMKASLRLPKWLEASI
ncbi:hypothetical protein OROHE_002096 [Orobanche hederae]